MTRYAQEVAKVGLQLKAPKTKLWAPHAATEAHIPEDLKKYRVPSLVAVGTPVPYARATMRPWWEGQEEDDRTDVPLDIAGMTQEPWDFLERQEEYIERVLKLVEHGLGVVHALTLLRVWTQGAGVHIIRLVQVTQCWAISVDRNF